MNDNTVDLRPAKEMKKNRTKNSIQDSECSRTERAVNEKEANFVPPICDTKNARAPGHQYADGDGLPTFLL